MPSLKGVSPMKYAIIDGYMLTEMSEKGFHARAPNEHIEVVCAATAHRLVRAGIVHDTRLWIDGNGRIRRASDEPNP
jgi:hypothetical protein